MWRRAPLCGSALRVGVSANAFARCVYFTESEGVCVCVCVCVCVGVSVRVSAPQQREWQRQVGWSAGPGPGVGAAPPRPAPPAATPPTGGGLRAAAGRSPLGPGGGGRPLSPGRASEHVQSRAPARPPPVARRPPPARRPLAPPPRLSPDVRSPGSQVAAPCARGASGRSSPRAARGRAGAEGA